MRDQIAPLVEKVKQKDTLALARLLTLLERMGPQGLVVSDDLLNPPCPAFRVGITGPPGAGKSTLVGGLVKELRKRDLRVGIIAVDPSSPFSHGAILGDRIRYSEHFGDEKVFIRSLGSRGSLGGLSSAAYLMLRAFDCFGFDIVLIETVGVGQTELEVMHVADYISVVLVPESGDSVQAMKAGLLEIAHLFVVNKADRPGANGLVKELESMVHLGGSSSEIKVVKTSAVKGEGVQEVCDLCLGERSTSNYLKRRNSADRLQWEAMALLRMEAEKRILYQVQSITSLEDFKKLFQ